MTCRLLTLILFLPVITTASPQLNFGNAKSQKPNSIPVSPCPAIFQYENYEGQIIGVVRYPPTIKATGEPFTVNIDVHIEEYLPEIINNPLQLQLFEERNDLKTALRILRNVENIPIILQLKFPTTFPVPLLTTIKVNDRIVCRGNAVDSINGYSTFNANFVLYPTLKNVPNQQVTNNKPPVKTDTRTVIEQISVTNCKCPIVPVPSCPECPQCNRNVNNCPPPVIKECPSVYAEKQVECPVQCPPVKDCGPLTTVVRESPGAISIHIQRLSNQSDNINPQFVQGDQRTDFAVRNKREIHTEDCGHSFVPNIYNDDRNSSQRGEWPWAAAIFELKNIGNIVFKCGGSIIGKHYIITGNLFSRNVMQVAYTMKISGAQGNSQTFLFCIKTGRNTGNCVSTANGVMEKDKLLIMLGQHDISKIESGVQYHTIKEITRHPGNNNDLAILHLNSAITYTNYIRPVCLWTNSHKNNMGFEHKRGTVVGWGNINKHHELADHLMKTELKIVSNDKCGPREKTNICAETGSTHFSADIGSGMFVSLRTQGDERTQWFLRGIVNLSEESRTKAGAKFRENIVLADISKTREWIRRVIE